MRAHRRPLSVFARNRSTGFETAQLAFVHARIGGSISHLAGDDEGFDQLWTQNLIALTDRIIRQGRALVRAIEALGTIQPTGPFELALARLLMAAYKRFLQAIVKAVPTRVSSDAVLRVYC